MLPARTAHAWLPCAGYGGGGANALPMDCRRKAASRWLPLQDASSMSCRSSELMRPCVCTVSTGGGLLLLLLLGSTSAAEEKGNAKHPAACLACIK